MNLLFANDRRGAYPDSWYAATAAPLPPFAALQGDTRADVCIVGAGYSGLSTGLHLVEKGYKVAIIEGARVGWGASGRNGGQVINGMSGIEKLRKKHGGGIADILDNLRWRGNGTRYLPEHTNPEKTEKIYNELVEKIL